MINSKTNLKSTKKDGFYWDGDIAYPSVTQILSVIDKPSLRYWHGQQVYQAMVDNPNLTEEEALAYPEKQRRRAMNRGTTVHSVVEAYKRGHAPSLESIPKKFHGYVRAFYRFMEAMDIEMLDQEKTIFSQVHRYAGTLDIIAKIKSKTFVLDVKTGKDIYPEAFYQTSAYRQAVVEQDRWIDGIGVILLQENGIYKFQTSFDYDENFEVFLACKKIFEVSNKHLLEKVNYFQRFENHKSLDVDSN